jgi:hypothetical protein
MVANHQGGRNQGGITCGSKSASVCWARPSKQQDQFLSLSAPPKSSRAPDDPENRARDRPGTHSTGHVGHRQPKMTGLPPDVADREMQPGVPTNGPNQHDLDSRLMICRGC